MARRYLIRAASVTVVSLLALQGCSSETNVKPAKEFQFQIPIPRALTLDEISKLKASLCGPSGDPPVHSLSAAAFDDYSAKPRTTDPGWQSFIKIYKQVRGDAIKCGWSVEVDGYTQSSDPVGTADELSQQRADSTREALIAAGYPADSVKAIGRGVGGTSSGDRRVDVRFVRR
jgi:hypothetical protein